LSLSPLRQEQAQVMPRKKAPLELEVELTKGL
jgi:hypothetical protein